MSVKREVTIDVVHNEIAMDNTRSTIYIIVEGETDAKLLEDFTIEENCSIYQVKTRDKVIELMSRLQQEGKNDCVVAIVDNDQHRIFNDENLPEHTFYTDTNDIETMILWSDCFYKIAHQLFASSKTPDKAAVDSIRDMIIDRAMKIGELRAVSKRNGWNLSFKESSSHKEIDYSKFLKRQDLQYAGDDVLVRTVKNHSRMPAIPEDKAIEDMVLLSNEAYDPKMLVVGHDATKVISFALKQMLCNHDTKGLEYNQVEIVFRAAYTNEAFKDSTLRERMEKAVENIGVKYLLD